MDVVITKNEEKLLKKTLALVPMPGISLSYYELLGYLYGIAITPDLIKPNEWIPIIFGERMPCYETKEQARQMIATLLTVLNRHISGFNDGILIMPFDMDDLDEKDIEGVLEWTSGFEEALSLRPECWEEELEDLSSEELDHLMSSLIVIEGVVHPDEAMDMFDHMSEAKLAEIGVVLPKSDIEKTMQVQVYMLQALGLAVETIQFHGAKLESKRQALTRSSAMPFPVRSSTIGKNAGCPCGSTKKYQECCGRKPRGATTLDDVTSKTAGSNVIHGDFPQHRHRKKAKESRGFKGPNYQLEISLAYTEPPVWRRIQVPSFMTLGDLHMVIQYCMGWQDMHMHQFQAGLRFYGPQSGDDDADIPIFDESRTQLLDLEQELLQGTVYTYDFGDSWEHVVMLEKVIPESEGKLYPVLLDGRRACPPEDIGGVPGYQNFLEALTNPEDEKHLDMPHIPNLNGYDPEHFGKDAINTLLQTVYGK